MNSLRQYLFLVCMIVILGLVINLLQSCNGKSRSEDPPNVILFATDDLNDWINPLGYSQANTPNLDRLAKSGVVFNNAHAPGVYCAPSRTAIFTGLHATTTGCYQNQVFHYEHPELVSLQMAFQQGGYNTYGAGKLYHHPGGYLDPRGWDEYFARSQEVKDKGWAMGSYGEQDVPRPDRIPYSRYYTETGLDQLIGGGFMEWGPIDNEKEDEMADAIRTNWACDVLRREHDKPFFLALGLYAPHFPNYSPQKYFDLYNRDSIQLPEYKPDDLDDVPPTIRKEMMSRMKRYQLELERIDAVKDGVHAYLAAVSFADAMLGRILDALEASPYLENTIIVMWSDHGFHHGEKGNWGKHTLWQRTSHVPLIWSGKGIANNERVETTVSLVDIYPTLIELCDLPVERQMDGVSLVPSLEDPSASTDRDVFLPSHRRGSYAVINMNWRYIYYNDGTEELYNVKEDPNEWDNLAGELKFKNLIQNFKKSAPSVFAPEGIPKNELKLVVEGDSFHWVRKE